MPSRYDTYMIPPAKGLNLNDDPYRLQPGDLMSGTNIKINEDGSFERIDGYTDLLTDIGTTEYCISLTEFERWDGSIEIFVLYDTYLKKIDPATWTYRNIYTNMSTGKIFHSCAYGDRLFFGNAYDANRYCAPVYRHHVERTTIATVDATNTATAVALSSAILADYIVHTSSVLQHNEIDGTNLITAATVTGLATCITWANDFKAKYNTHKSQSGIHPDNDDYHLIEVADCTNAATLYTLINQEKLCYNQHIADGRTLQWGITTPLTAITGGALVSGGNLASGDYQWYYTYYNSVDGYESPPSSVFTTACAGTSCNAVNLTGIGISTDPQVTHKRLYRTMVEGATYYRLDTITNADTNYSDITSDGGLGIIIPTEEYTSIPQTNIFTEFNNVIYMAGSLTMPYRMYFTQTSYPFYFKSTNFFDFSVRITAIARVVNGLVVFEDTKMWFLPGTLPHNLSRIQISDSIGCTNQSAWCPIKGSIVFLSRYGLYSFDGTGITHLSRNIDNALLTKTLDNASLCYDAYNDELYVLFAD
jgi:hypothetical protein